MNKPFLLKLKDIFSIRLNGKSLFGLLLVMFLSSALLAQQPARMPDNGRVLTKVDSHDAGIESMLKKYDKQIYFTQNKGQWPSGVLYKADFTYGQAVATQNGMLISSFDPASVGARSKWVMDQEEAQHDGRMFTTPMPNLKGHAWLMNFVGSSPAMTMSNKDGHSDVSNYFVGNASATNVQSFNEVWYNNVYKNIDVRYYPSAQGALEYDIIAKPGSNPASIAIKFDGIDKMEVNADGHLVLSTSVGSMDLPEPYAYQTINGREVKVDAAYALNDKNQLTFIIGKYDTSLPLIIDPIAMRWATWITNNSAADNHGHCIWVDPAGNIYVVSRFSGSGLITTPGAFDTAPNGGLDLNIGKYTEPASVGGAGVRVWQTYLGGSSDENPYVAEMGPDGNLYIAGYTTSTDFPITGNGVFSGTGLDKRTEDGQNTFIVKIDPLGTSIKGAVLGGSISGTSSSDDNVVDLRITPTGFLILGGYTSATNLSTNYPSSGASNTNNGSTDFWMFKVNQNLDAVSWMKNWGGSGADQINILVNHPTTGDIYSGGTTYSTSGLGLVSPRQGTSSGDADDAVGYLQKMNSAGTIQWSSYFNSSSNSRTTTVLCMEFNAAKTAIYFGGMTEGLASSNLSSSGAYDNSQNGSRDFYVAKMALDQTFAYGTYVGSTADEDNMMGLNVDANDDVYIFGYTYATGTLFPTAGNPLQSTMAGGSRDKVFFKLETDLSALLYSTYYGGAADDSDPVGERGIKFSNCRIYTIVTAQSNNIPLTQGAVTTGKTSSTSIYEPALIVWANPPDLGNNTITQNQFVCNGATPAELTGSTPTYELPTIIRNGTTSAHPSVGTASAYQWQVSTDQTTWTNIPGATGINLTAAQMGTSTVTRYFRRIINGDACVLNNGNSVVTIAVFTISGTQVNNTCFGGTAGSIDISISGNSGAVTYNWGGGITTQDRTGLAAGTYTVTATAANGCTATATFTITQPTQIAFTPTPTNASCGASNGSITVTGVTGGTGSYQYQLNNGAFQGGNTFTGLAGGTYNITVKDANGCTRTIAATVGSANPLTLAVQSQSNPTCFNGNNGSITVAPSGGTSPFQYQLNGGPFQSSATFNGLTAGTYTIIVKDANNCTAQVIVTLSQPQNPSLIVPTNTICEGSSVTLSANPNGQNVASYLWSNGATTPTITVSTPGVYWVSLISANGCTSNTDTVALNVRPAPNIELDTLINVPCYGDSTGAIDVTVTTTIASCLAEPQTSPEGCTNCTSTASGNTNVTVLAGQKVCITGSFTGQLTINTGGKAVICSNISPQSVNVNGGELYITSTGVLNANNFSGAAGSIIRNYGNIITNNFTTNGRFYNYGTVSCVGGFQIASSTGVFVNDGNFTCTGNFINYGVGMSNNSMQVGSQFTNAPGATFFNSCNLRIDSQFNCNSAFYNYGNILMDQSNTNASLPAGVTLVMGQGSYMICAQFNVHGTISGPTGPCSQIVVTNQSRLYSGSVLTGYIQWADLDNAIETNSGTYGPNITFTNTPTCGTIPDVYTYSWTGPNGFASASPDISNLPVGTYTITVTNSFGCSSTATFTITGPQSPVVGTILSSINASCGGTDGSLTVLGSGGTPDYEYSINGVNFFPTGLFSGLAGGNYTITVRDSAGCIATVNATVGNNAGPSASVTSRTNILCFGAATGAFTITASGGTPGYQYQLDNGAFGNSNVFTGLTAGNYVVTVRDANGCTTTVNVSVTQPNSPVSAGIGSQTNVLCFGNATGSVTITATGGTPGYTYQLGNGAFGNSNVFSGLTAGNYVVTVKDNNGCTTTVNVTITQPNAPLSASSSNQVNVLCFGNATGSFQIDASGGTQGYTYQLGNGSFGSSNVFSGLIAGTYVVTVKDNNGCTTTVSVTITQPNAPLSASSSNQVNVLCFGNATGSFQIDASGGTPGYTYQLGNGSFGNSNVFSGLTAGTYVVTVKDNNGCTTTVSVTITQPNAPLSASSSNQVNVLCYSNATGSFQVDALGGTPGYTYQLGNGSFGNSNVFSGLTAGTYVVTVKDNNGCTTTVSVTITQPNAPLSASSSNQVNVLCYGNATGSFQVDASGGTPGYTYQLGNGSFGSSNVFSGLIAGTYVVTVKDNNGCTTTVSVTITQPNAPLSASSSNQVNVLCYGNATGSFQIDAVGGTSAYQYQLDNGQFGNSNVFSGLIAGTYVVTVKDANGCTTTVSVTITQPNAPLSASSSNQVNVLCYGNATGSFQIDAFGGTPGYTYQLGNGAFGNSNVFSGLVAGTYVVTVKDANGCTTTVSVTITQPNAPLSASSSNQLNILCYGNATGSFQVNVSGGTPGYTYQLDNGAFGSSNVFSGLIAGTYVVTVKDNNGCTTTVNVTITQPNAPLSASSSNQVNVLCYGNATGSFQVDVTGGTPGYTYQLGNGSFGNNNVFSGLTAGTYVVTVKDANGCTTTVSVTITQPNAPLSAGIDSQTNVLCFGNATGSVTIAVSGGTVGNGYQYQLGNGPLQLSPTFNGLIAGNYVVTVSDANGCIDTVNVTITQPNGGLTASSSNQVNVLCYGNATGSFQVDALGGTPGYTYQLGNGAFGNSNVFSGLVAGTYVVTVKDASGCTTTVTVTITQPNAPLSASSSNQVNVLCYGDATGSFQIDATGGTPAYQYQLGNGAFGNSNVFSGLVAGTYVVTVKDANGCTTTISVTITQPNVPLSASSSNQVNVLCFGNATGSFQIDALGGTPGYTYQLGNGQFVNSNVFSGLTAGTYVVTVKDNNGCTTTVSVTITQPNAPLSATISNSVDVCFGYAVGSATVSPSGGTTPYTYSWNTIPAQTVATATGLAAGSYIVTVTDSNGCTTTASVTINSNAIPNAGGDQNVCEETADLVDAAQDQSWSALAGNPANATVNPVTGAVSGMTVGGTYLFALTSTFGCSDTVAVATTSNCPIIANPDYVTTPEDSSVTIDVPNNDTDPDGNIDNGSVTIIDPPNNGTVIVNPDGTIIYTPNPNYNGPDSLIYQICDTGMPVYCDTALVVIIVTPVNDPPIANLDTTTTPEDTPIVIDVPDNDTDVDGNIDNGSVTIIDPPNNGTVIVNPDGTIIYTPDTNYNGVDTLIYQICDTGMPVLCDTALVIINVTPVNDPPVAVTDTASTVEDSPININIDINDYDVDGNLDTNSVVIVIPPVNGSATYDPNLGEIIYTPNPDFFGTDSLLYNICDSLGLCDTAWVYIVIESVPDITLDPSIFPSGNNISCFGANDGSIDLTIDLGTPPYIISWTGPNGFTSSSEDISGLAPGTYTVIVTDLNGNIAQGSITLTEPTLLQGSGVVFSYNGGYNVSCGGQSPACDGSIDYTVTGGSPVYTISWTGPNGFTANTQDISGLCAGTYTIVVTDVNGCTVTNTYNLTAPPPVDPTVVYANYNGYNVSCNGSCNGSINLTVNGGVAPFTYAWVGPNNFSSTSEDINSLCAGSYSVLVTDANGCTATVNVTLTEPPVLSASVLAATYNGGVNVSCANACDGSINATITGGVAPLTFAWTGPNGFTSSSEDISALCAGTYVLTVTDANGCTTSQTITLTQPAPVTVSLAAAVFAGGFNVSCVGSCNGSINATIGGGTAPYSYSWIGPNGFVAVTEDISTLCVGTYTLTVTDANGCSATQTITLIPPPALEVGGAAFEFNGGYNISCANACDGSIDLVVSGGVAPFVISWTGPNNFSSSSEDIANLCAGTYTVTVTDANGCTSSQTITITQPPLLSVSLQAALYNGEVNVSCANACDGSINATIGGGTIPYSYSWIGPNGFVAVTQDLSNLCAGTYVLTVTDANGCTASQTITLQAPDTLEASAVAAITDGGTNISCNGVCDGSIDLTITGGSQPYSINWTGPNGFVSTEEDISSLCVGTYVATIVDANGCTTSVTITLSEPPPVSSSGIVSTYAGGFNVGCNGGSNGSIDLTVTGGSGSYTYNWSGPNNYTANTADISGLVAGTYTVIISDVNGCSDTLTFNLTEPEVITTSATTTPSSCGQPNGSINLSVAGGSGVFSFSWTGPNSFTANTQDLTGIVGGEYIVEVIDTNGCSVFDTINVTLKPLVTATGVISNSTCNTSCNGAIDLTVTTGEDPYTFAWSGPNSFSSTSEDISSLCQGNYIVIVTDADGCSFADTFNIAAPEPVALTVTGLNAATCTASNGSISINPTGGSGGYSFSWTGPNGFTSTEQNLNGVAEGSYTVTVSDSLGCTHDQTINVGSVSNLVLAATSVNATCHGLNNGTACADATGATAPISYLWSTGDTTQCVDSLAPGTYIVAITDANGCAGSDTIVITEPELLAIAGDVLVYPNGYNVSVINGSDGAIDISVTGGSGVYTYLWTLVNDSTAEDQLNLVADTYVVVVADANGCTVTAEYILEQPPIIELPTGFSPGNFDGMNDYYVIHGIDGLIDNKFTVFNRWGQVIYEKEGYQNDWAGTNQNGNMMPDGTYFVLFTVKVPGQGELTFKATVEQRQNLGK